MQKLTHPPTLRDNMAKTKEDLAKSREIREEVIKKFGEVPTSIWTPDYGWGKHIIELDSRKQQAMAKKKHEKMDYGNEKSWDSKLDGNSKDELAKAFGMSSQNVRGKQSGLSTFPPDLARRIVEFYSEKGDTVLDPCCGHNSRMQVTYEMERNYIGYDVCKEFMDFNRNIADEIQGKGEQAVLFAPKSTIILREQSSERMIEDDNSIDMVYTSPPYYDIEYYDEHPDQLGYGHTYDEFMEGITRLLSESFRVLKNDKYCVWNINDFRKDGDYFMYHADIARAMERVGFKLWDIVIVAWKSCIGACFASQIVDRKINAKKHEFLIVGKKI